MSAPIWRKSSYSGQAENCVEVAFGSAEAAVRDSKQPSAGAVRCSAPTWRAFLDAVVRSV